MSYVISDWRATRFFAVKYKASAASTQLMDQRVALAVLAAPIFSLIPTLFPSLLATPDEVLRLPGLDNVSNAITLLTAASFFKYISLFGSFPMLLLQTFSEQRLSSSALSWLFCTKLCNNLLLSSYSVASLIVATPATTSGKIDGKPFLPPVSALHEKTVVGLVATDVFASLAAFTLLVGLNYEDVSSLSVGACAVLAAIVAVKVWRLAFHIYRLLNNLDWTEPGHRLHALYFHITPHSFRGRVLRLILLILVSFPFDFLQHYTRICKLFYLVEGHFALYL